MGIFDSRRRRKNKQEVRHVILREAERLIERESKPVSIPKVSNMSPAVEREVISDVAELVLLRRTRDELKENRTSLLIKFDNGEIDSTEFRKISMSIIQEASIVADKIKKIEANLTRMGHRGIL